ncbi:hypothetical protein M5D96_010954 [Drosophila gunungcola]|uniref:Uncharacterized protein n=1 Tax=Drosophila gunungcola TaxID=103775 RepID=A0A9P9YGE4_9MUSC|nr:hypothetical protein M5D96_010954 [Drosophila gunungcola]
MAPQLSNGQHYVESARVYMKRDSSIRIKCCLCKADTFAGGEWEDFLRHLVNGDVDEIQDEVQVELANLSEADIGQEPEVAEHQEPELFTNVEFLEDEQVNDELSSLSEEESNQDEPGKISHQDYILNKPNKPFYSLHRTRPEIIQYFIELLRRHKFLWSSHRGTNREDRLKSSQQVIGASARFLQVWFERQYVMQLSNSYFRCRHPKYYRSLLRFMPTSHISVTICEECDRRFLNDLQLRLHKFRVHDGPNPNVCQVCGHSCKTSSALAVHRRTHERPRLACPHCSRQFRENYTLKCHIRKFHEGDSVRRFSCSVCRRSFQTMEVLELHKLVHAESPKALVGVGVGLVAVGGASYLLYRHLTRDVMPQKWRRVGTVQRIHFFPVKSCAPLEIAQPDVEYDVDVLSMSFEGIRDRTLMVDLPDLELDFEKLEGPEKDVRTAVWGVPVDVMPCGDRINKWFSQAILKKDSGLKLVHYAYPKPVMTINPRLKNMPFIRQEDSGTFNDATSYMLMNLSSVADLNTRLKNPVDAQQFRGNFELKMDVDEPYAEDNWKWLRIGDDAVFRSVAPCTRCIFPNINIKSGGSNATFDLSPKALVGVGVGLVAVGGASYLLYRHLTRDVMPQKWRRVGTVQAIHFFPVKSCAPLEIWKPDVEYDCDDMPDLELDFEKLDGPEKDVRTAVWGVPVDVMPCGDRINKWFSQAILKKDSGLKLVHYPYPKPVKASNPDLKDMPSVRQEDTGAFTDATSFMLMNLSSVADLNTRLKNPVDALQFRGSFDLKMDVDEPYAEDNWQWLRIGDDAVFRTVGPCTRCIVPNIDWIRHIFREFLRSIWQPVSVYHMFGEMAIANGAEEEEHEVRTAKSRKCFYLKKMIGDYIDTSVRVVATVFLADFLQRLYRCVVEYVRYSRYYLPEDRLWTVVRRSYTYNNKSAYLLLAYLIVGLSRISVSGNFRSVVPTVIDLGQSTLSYAHWIRDSHGLDYAAGMASNYFHGYLKLSLPERKDDGLKHRMALYEDKMNVTFGVDRLVILIPDEMFVSGELDSKYLEKVEHAVYKLKHRINGKFYYFAMEGATPMLSFFDAMQFNLSATWQMQELKREIWLKFYKHLKELITTWPETRNEVELIIYNFTSVHIVETVFLADILQRLFLSVVEYVRHKPNYLPEDRVRRILRRSFTYRNKSKCLLWCVFLGMVISVTGNLRAVFPSFKFLSPLTDLYWLRDSHGLDYATGMALNWFHGRLKASLPERQDDGLKPRMDVYEMTQGDRILKHDVYRKKVNDKIYYFVVELAEPMMSFSEALVSGSTGTWQMKELEREIRMRFNEKLAELIHMCPETRNLAIIYKSHDDEGNPVDLTDWLISHMGKKKTKNS